MNPLSPHFEPTRAAAWAALERVQPHAYAGSRNHLMGAATQLSPYFTHGLLTQREAFDFLHQRSPLHPQHKLVYEFGWRAYFRHVWAQLDDGIFDSLHPGPLPDAAYHLEMPEDVRQARSGVPVIDRAVRCLYASGHLHNHARMWLASYLVHVRKVAWRVGADWLYGHLLDGDLASNHLSWQWVAGTGSSKPYLFNADNVARYAPPDWHSPGTVIDCSYDTLDAMARSGRPVKTTPQGDGVEEPAVWSVPQHVPPSPLQAADVNGRDVWLVHPWALGEPPPDLPASCVRVGLRMAEHHNAWPWSAARWSFVGHRMAELTSLRWHADQHTLTQALAGARSVQTVADPHISPLLPPRVVQRQPLDLFGEVRMHCSSFSVWWKHATRGVNRLNDLPGMAAWADSHAAGPLFDALSGT